MVTPQIGGGTSGAKSTGTNTQFWVKCPNRKDSVFGGEESGQLVTLRVSSSRLGASSS